MEGTRTEPTAAVSATAEPEMPPMIMPVRTATMESPPVKCPIRALEKSTARRLMPPWHMISPTRMNPGMARRAKESIPIIRRWAMTCRGISPRMQAAAAAAPKAK